MDTTTIELPARDHEYITAHEKINERNKGVLNWMGRHKKITAITALSLLAAAAWLNPGSREWLQNQYDQMYGNLTDAGRKWLDSITPEWLKKTAENVEKTAETLKEGKQTIESGVRDAQLMAKYPVETAQGFTEGMKQGAGNLVKKLPDGDLILQHPGEAAQGFKQGLQEGAGNVAEKAADAALGPAGPTLRKGFMDFVKKWWK